MRREIRRAGDVFSADGHPLGHVDCFVVDGDDRVTYIVLERSHLFGRRDVTITIEAAARVATDSITLDLTKAEVAELSAVPLRRQAA
jgi:PRC-barrel domain